MTDYVSIVNRALLDVGIKKVISGLTQDSEEAKIAATYIEPLRDELLRMAPWDCATNYANLVYITSVPGTPENTGAGSTLWAKGIPAPPWAFEYQYPVDCLKALFIIPQFQTGFSGGIPITTAVMGGAPALWNGPPAKFKVAIDQFFVISIAGVVAGGTGYAVGEIVSVDNSTATPPPAGADALLRVAAISGGGVVTSLSVISQVYGASPAQGGSYYNIPPMPAATTTVTGSGAGLTINASFVPVTANGYIEQVNQRVILTNQEFATLCYIKRVTDPNVMDPLFIDAWVQVLASRMVMSLAGDKAQANIAVQRCNEMIMEARKADGNEGLTVNNITPDWIRGRGVNFSDDPWSGGGYDFQWGNTFPLYT